MYADLNILWPTSHLIYLANKQFNQQSRKGKQKSSDQTDSLDIWKGIHQDEQNRLREQVECAIRCQSTFSLTRSSHHGLTNQISPHTFLSSGL